MKTEIGGTFKWSEEQIEAYAAAFREGDAVKVKGDWHEVVRKEDVGIRSDVIHTIPIVSTITTEDNSYNLNCVYDKEGNFGGITKGFLKSHVKSPYNIITPKDYDVQEGDKLVWLGESNEFLTFGKVYIATGVFLGCGISYVADDGLWRFIRPLSVKYWGTIPRYENVKEEEGVNSKCERSGNTGKFKVGDRVFIKANGRYEGCIGEVDGIHVTDDSVTCDIAFADGNFCWVYANELELVEEEEEVNEKTELVDAIEYSGKFEEGDLVKVKVAAFKASEPDIGRVGVISEVNSFETNAAYRVVFNEGDFDFFNEAELELIDRKEKSVEQEAFEYLLTLDKTLVRIFLTDEINDWAKEYMRQKDYSSAKRAIDILEKLEKGE